MSSSKNYEISIKKYFPKKKNVYFFEPNFIVAKFPFYVSNHTQTLFELERIVSGLEDENRTIILLSKSFYVKILIVNYFFNNSFGDYLEFIHDLSFSSYFKPSYGLKFDLSTKIVSSSRKRSKRRFSADFEHTKRRLRLYLLLLHPFKLLEYKFTDLLNIKLVRLFLSAGPELLEKYLGKKLLKYLQHHFSNTTKNPNSDPKSNKGKGYILEQDKTKFFGFLKFLTETLKFNTEEINTFLENFGLILRFASMPDTLVHTFKKKKISRKAKMEYLRSDGGEEDRILIPKELRRKIEKMILKYPVYEGWSNEQGSNEEDGLGINLKDLSSLSGKVIACLIHRYMMFWMVEKINKLIRKQKIHHHFTSQIILLPELQEQVKFKSSKLNTSEEQKHKKKKKKKTNKYSEEVVEKVEDEVRLERSLKREDLSKFSDLCVNLVTEHLNVVSFHGLSKSVKFASSLRIFMKMLSDLNTRKFYLMKNLRIYFLNRGRELDKLKYLTISNEQRKEVQKYYGYMKKKEKKKIRKKEEKRRQILKNKNKSSRGMMNPSHLGVGGAGQGKKIDLVQNKLLSRVVCVDHSFGKFYYDMKDLLFTRIWKLYYLHLLNVLNEVLSGIDLSCTDDTDKPLLILCEPSNIEILSNFYLSEFLSDLIELQEEKKKIQRDDILSSIIVIQSVARMKIQRDRYEDKIRRDILKRVFKMRRERAAVHIQRWWRYNRVRKAEVRERSATIIQRWFRKCMESRRQSAARVIQYHCRQHLRRKVETWENSMLSGTVQFLQRTYRRAKKTDELIRRRDHLVKNYFSFVNPNSLSTSELIKARRRGGANSELSSAQNFNSNTTTGKDINRRRNYNSDSSSSYEEQDDEEDVHRDVEEEGEYETDEEDYQN